MTDIKKESIVFENNNQAILVVPSVKQNAEDIAAALDLPAYNTVMLILGGADNIDEKLKPRLTQLFSRGIARAAVEAGAVIIDGGTQAGVMAMMGEGVAARGYKTPLIGVAPLSKVSYPGGSSAGQTPLEPNHSHFILVEGNNWGSETATLFNLSNALTSKKENATNNNGKLVNPGASAKIPVVAVVAGGGSVTKSEVLNVVRKNIPIIIVEGSGGFADEVAAAWQKKELLPDEPVMAEIIADGQIHIHQLNNSVQGIERLIIRELGTDKVLMQAWETFADYDFNASRQQSKFGKLQMGILVVGVIGTALVILQQVAAPRDGSSLKTVAQLWADEHYGWWMLYYLLILIPIVLTVLITAANRFKEGSKWLLLRAGAESIKREIFRYRTRAMYYSDNAEQQLALRIEDITRRTMRTEVNSSALKPYNKDNGFPPYMYAAHVGDDGFSILMPDRYIEIRLEDQLNYFKRSAVKLEKRLRLLYWGIFIIGGIGTFLAAIGQQVWIALTTSITAAFGTYLGYRQTESTLTKYNQALTDLSNVKAWWNALSSEEQSMQENINSLVLHTEQVLQSELDGWIQQMQNSLAELRKEQETRAEKNKSEKEENKEPQQALKPAVAQNNGKAKVEDEQVAQRVTVNAPDVNRNKTDIVTIPGSEDIKTKTPVVADKPDESEDNKVNAVDGIKNDNDGDAKGITSTSEKDNK